MIMGHRHPPIIKALKAATDNTTSFGAPTAIETDMAELICEMVPAVEKVRMVNSGTGSLYVGHTSSKRIYRREKFIKFEDVTMAGRRCFSDKSR